MVGIVLLAAGGSVPVVSSRYADGIIGPPALFDRAVFDQLDALRGDVGATPPGMIDIDTEADRYAM